MSCAEISVMCKPGANFLAGPAFPFPSFKLVSSYRCLIGEKNPSDLSHNNQEKENGHAFFFYSRLKANKTCTCTNYPYLFPHSSSLSICRYLVWVCCCCRVIMLSCVYCTLLLEDVMTLKLYLPQLDLKSILSYAESELKEKTKAPLHRCL